MAEDFDRFLASARAPPERALDRRFVARVQAQIALEERLSGQRRALIIRFAEQLAGLLAVAAGLWWISRAPLVSDWFADSPALGLAMLIAAVALLIGVLSLRPDADPASFAAV